MRTPNQFASRTAPILLALAAAALLLAGCDSMRADPDAEFRDGVYVAAWSHARADGWRPYLRLRVRAGELHEICFNAVHEDGTILLQDESFLERYRLEHDVSLQGYIHATISETLEAQARRVRAAADALEWSVALYGLLGETVSAARVGLTSDDAGVAEFPATEPYLVSDAADELGWRAELLVVYEGERIAAVDYRETRLENDGSLRVKDQDEAYEATYGSLVGVSHAETVDLLERAATGAASVTEAEEAVGADALSGATITRRRFFELASLLEARRSVPVLPNRLCR